MDNNYLIIIVSFLLGLIAITFLIVRFTEKKRFNKFIHNNQSLLENGFIVSDNRLTGVFHDKQIEISVNKVRNELKIYLGVFVSAPTENSLEINNASKLIYRKDKEGIWIGKHFATNKKMKVKTSELKELLREINIK